MDSKLLGPEPLAASPLPSQARRIEEERRQLQRLKEVQDARAPKGAAGRSRHFLAPTPLQEKKRKQESERRKNLGGVFALSADDFDKAR